jgi:lactose/L-arabinose transport system substrate-binding protein
MSTPEKQSITPTPSSALSAMRENLSRRSFLKGTAASALLATGGTSLLAACGGSAPAVLTSNSLTQKGEITIWDRSGDLFQVFDATIGTFNKKYPNIKVNHVAVDVDAKLPTTLVSSVSVPDGAFYEDNNLPMENEHFYDLTEWIQPYVKDIVPFKLQVNTSGGKILGIPWDLDPGLLFYREDLLQQVGVDPTSINTYDDLITAAQTLQSKLGPKVKPIHLEQDPGLTILWTEMFANQQGTSMGNLQNQVQVNNQAYLNIMNFYQKVSSMGLGTHEVYLSPGDLAAIDAGQVAFYPWAIWYVYGADLLFKQSKGLWRAMALPAWTQGGTRAAVMGGSSFIIPKKAKNPHQAWLFYEHLVFSPEGYQAVYGPNKVYPGGINTSLPSYFPALTGKQLFQNSLGLAGQNLWDVATATAKSIPGNYVYPTWYNQASQYLGSDIQHLLAGQMTPQQVLDQATNNIQNKLVNRS